MSYIPTIGLEIHAELKTRTKMFCDSRNDPDEKRPNVNVCPVCLAHPGTLPVINREAVRHVLRVGAALGGTLADYTEFDRKNYFYPDLPKGYQLSQYEYPLVSGGELAGVAITRVHLEEDTASSMHISTSLNAGDEEAGSTVVDYNRAGVPLMELVSEPVIHSAEEASAFARELQLLLRYLGASEAHMEKGEMRVEANVSVAAATERYKKQDTRNKQLGTKVEIKNLNSFNIMERAVTYEIKRQIEMLERGEKIAQETRGWDDGKQVTFPQRLKEGSADYRYFPDPDLPSLKLSEISEFSRDALISGMPETPRGRRERYVGLGLKRQDAEMFVRRPGYGALFDAVAGALPASDPTVLLTANLIANNVAGIRDTKERDTDFSADMPMSSQHLKVLVSMIVSKKITSNAAKIVLSESLKTGQDPEKVAADKGLLGTFNVADLDGIVGNVLKQNGKVVMEYQAGKTAALQFLVGQVMRASKGAADPLVVRSVIDKVLEGLKSQ